MREKKPSLGPLSRRRERWFYLLILPWLMGLVLFQAGPLLAGLGIAMTDWPLPQPPRFVGLDHFSAIWQDAIAWRALLNTVYYALGVVPLGLALSLGLALLLNTARVATPFFRSLFFLPSVINGAATVLVWGWAFHPQFGPVNAALGGLGIQGPGWLQSEPWAMPTIILMGLWNTGANILIYLAALQGTPVDLLEAATLDGAGRFQRFRRIVLPLISPVTFYLIVSNTIAAFQIFTPTYLLTRGGPNNATLTLPLYIYLNAFRYGRLGYGSALAVLLMVITLALAWLQFRLARRYVFYLGGEG